MTSLRQINRIGLDPLLRPPSLMLTSNIASQHKHSVPVLLIMDSLVNFLLLTDCSSIYICWCRQCWCGARSQSWLSVWSWLLGNKNTGLDRKQTYYIPPLCTLCTQSMNIVGFPFHQTNVSQRWNSTQWVIQIIVEDLTPLLSPCGLRGQ